MGTAFGGLAGSASAHAQDIEVRLRHMEDALSAMQRKMSTSDKRAARMAAVNVVYEFGKLSSDAQNAYGSQGVSANTASTARAAQINKIATQYLVNGR